MIPRETLKNLASPSPSVASGDPDSESGLERGRGHRSARCPYLLGQCQNAPLTSAVTASFRQDRAESEVVHAERVVQEGFKKPGWKQADLPATRKEDYRKVKLALPLRSETTATIKWITQRLVAS
jgi:hypothetical protein